MKFGTLKAILFFVLTSLILAGCSTPYRQQSLANKILFGYSGFNELKLAKGSYRIVINVPFHTRRKRIRQMVFLYAAERTLESGYQNFAITNSSTFRRKQFVGEKVRGDFFEGKFGEALSDYSQVRLKSRFYPGSGNYYSVMFIFMLTDEESENVASHSAKKVVSELKPLVVKDRAGS